MPKFHLQWHADQVSEDLVGRLPMWPLRTECTEHKMGIRSNDPVYIDQAPIDTACQQQTGRHRLISAIT